jgi:hypothetical protein
MTFLLKFRFLARLWQVIMTWSLTFMAISGSFWIAFLVPPILYVVYRFRLFCLFSYLLFVEIRIVWVWFRFVLFLFFHVYIFPFGFGFGFGLISFRFFFLLFSPFFLGVWFWFFTFLFYLQFFGSAHFSSCYSWRRNSCLIRTRWTRSTTLITTASFHCLSLS